MRLMRPGCMVGAATVILNTTISLLLLALPLLPSSPRFHPCYACTRCTHMLCQHYGHVDFSGHVNKHPLNAMLGHNDLLAKPPFRWQRHLSTGCPVGFQPPVPLLLGFSQVVQACLQVHVNAASPRLHGFCCNRLWGSRCGGCLCCRGD